MSKSSFSSVQNKKKFLVKCSEKDELHSVDVDFLKSLTPNEAVYITVNSKIEQNYYMFLGASDDTKDIVDVIVQLEFSLNKLYIMYPWLEERIKSFGLNTSNHSA